MKKSVIDDLCLVFIDTFCQYTPQQGWNRAFYFWEVIRLMCIESIFHSRFSFQMLNFFCFDISYLMVWFSFEIQIHNWNASNLNSFIVLSKLHYQLSDENIYLIHVSEDPFCSIYFYLPYTSFAHLGSYPHESKTDNLFIISILLLINAEDTNDVTIRKKMRCFSNLCRSKRLPAIRHTFIQIEHLNSGIFIYIPY